MPGLPQQLQTLARLTIRPTFGDQSCKPRASLQALECGGQNFIRILPTARHTSPPFHLMGMLPMQSSWNLSIIIENLNIASSSPECIKQCSAEQRIPCWFTGISSVNEQSQSKPSLSSRTSQSFMKNHGTSSSWKWSWPIQCLKACTMLRSKESPPTSR